MRTEIVADPADYRWSSYGVKIGHRKEELLDYDPCYLGLADSEKKRAESYAAWVKETIAAEELELIRKSLQRGQLTGSPRFVDEIEKKIERRVEFRGPGRPRKVEKYICPLFSSSSTSLPAFVTNLQRNI